MDSGKKFGQNNAQLNQAKSQANGARSSDFLSPPPDVEELRSALVFTPPVGTLYQIAYGYIAPMKRAALENPEMGDALYRLAAEWACGNLHSDEHPGLMAMNHKGKTGIELFKAVWNDLENDDGYTGKKRSLRSIFFLARQAGWFKQKGDEEF